MTTDARPWLNLRLEPAEVVRLQPGDIVVLKISRPLATSVLETIGEAWRETIRAAGHDNNLVILCGDAVEYEVLHTFQPPEVMSGPAG